MPAAFSLFLPGLSADGIAWLAFATLLGGLVRGFTGFGFAMVFMPLASTVLGPVGALALIWVVDAPFSLPLGLRSARKAEWGEVVPLLVAATVTIPIGLSLLVWLDPGTMRWLLAAMVLAAVAVLASGWRYHGRPGVPLSLGVGALSGLFNGLASVGGIPLAVFWLGAQRNDRFKTRANLQTYFGLATLISGAMLAAKGILTMAALTMALPLFLLYGAGLWAGTHAFGLASETTFRRIAYALILMSALTSLPLWDGLSWR